MKAAAIVCFATGLALGGQAANPDLAGRVTASDGSPVSKATVFIYSAGPKQGTSSFCPYCYADCAKKAQTDSQGRFEIPSLDSSLMFRLLTVAGGYESRFTTRIDPANGDVAIRLKPLSAETMNSPLRVKGVVLNENGLPLGEATITPQGIEKGDEQMWGGSERFVDPVAVTDEHGHFVLFCKTNILDTIYALADGRGVAQRWIEFKPGGDYMVRMEEGVTIKGRILREGQPLRGVSVNVDTTDRVCGSYLDCTPIATGADGRFLMANVPPNREFSFVAAMDSLKGLGTIPPKSFNAGPSGSTLDLGDISVGAGYRVEGKLVLSDGKPIPPGTRLLLSRQNVRDASTCKLGADGSFKFTDVPAQSIGLSVRVEGYKFSRRNPSLDWLNGGIVGKVSGDVTGLILLMEPGEWQFSNNPDDGPADGNRQPTELPLRGVVSFEGRPATVQTQRSSC